MQQGTVVTLESDIVANHTETTIRHTAMNFEPGRHVLDLNASRGLTQQARRNSKLPSKRGKRFCKDRVLSPEKVMSLEFLLKKHPAAWRRSQQNRSDNELFRLNPELAQEK